MQSNPIGSQNLFMPRKSQISCWSAISNVIITLLFGLNLFDQAKHDDCSNKKLKDYAFWRLMIGHLYLIENEINRKRFVRFFHLK